MPPVRRRYVISYLSEDQPFDQGVQIYALNLSAPFIPRLHFEKFERILPYCDMVFGNDADAIAWGSAAGLPATTTPEAIARHMAALPKVNDARERLVILTRGPNSSILVVGKQPVQTFPVAPIPDGEIIDTNGAGDAFAGGFLAAHILGRDLETCMLIGHRMGAMSVRHVGAVLLYGQGLADEPHQVGPQYTWPKVPVL